MTQIRTFLPGLKLPRGNILHTLARNYVPEPDKSKQESLKNPLRSLTHHHTNKRFDESLDTYYKQLNQNQIQNTTVSPTREKRQLGLAVMTLVLHITTFLA